ncbi:hypothetical protein OLMES_2291 [Oleiphilus messinensis]|uniref:Uncharacterized protein n=1 Tax=Oleiphilus messinensis TaxID=141451 RepID=A0A1Y0IAA1_9GAMM|nr:helix-hairpin-helix domain-containing protein [Oleiphilus messinensis]ARU56354.1 hypothetical protein OLMES_2291 [Oleiphilus messinensis]
MAKKDKFSVDKIIKRINSEFEKTTKQFDKLISDATTHLDHLQSQIQEPIKKLIEDIEKLREREIKRFHDELDRRLAEFNELQSSILSKIGVKSGTENQPALESKPSAAKAATGSRKAPTKSATKSAPKASSKAPTKAAKSTKAATSKTATKKAPAKATPKAANAKATAAKSTTTKAATSTAGKPKAATNKPAATKSTTAKATTPKPAATKTASTSTKKPAAKRTTQKAVKDTDLTKLTGVGPATAKQMNAAGITTLKQIAAPSTEDSKALEAFTKIKGSDKWSDEAKTLLG